MLWEGVTAGTGKRTSWPFCTSSSLSIKDPFDKLDLPRYFFFRCIPLQRKKRRNVIFNEFPTDAGSERKSTWNIGRVSCSWIACAVGEGSVLAINSRDEKHLVYSTDEPEATMQKCTSQRNAQMRSTSAPVQLLPSVSTTMVSANYELYANYVCMFIIEAIARSYNFHDIFPHPGCHEPTQRSLRNLLGENHNNNSGNLD